MLIIVLFLLLLLWLLWPQKRQEKIKPVNQVSLKTAETQQTAKQQSIKQKLKATTQSKDSQHNVIKKALKSEEDWSYLAIYRRLEWAEVCQHYFWIAIGEKKTPPADFVSEFLKRGHVDEVIAIDSTVVTALRRYQNRCETLKAEVFSYAQVVEEWPQYGAVAAELQDMLLNVPARTEKEKNLKTHYQLAQAFRQAQKDLERAKEQTAELNKQEKQELHGQITAINAEMAQLKDWLDVETATVRYHELVTEISALKDHLENKFNLESEAYQEAKVSLVNQWIELQSRLIGDDPDVFKVVKMATEWTDSTIDMGFGGSVFRADMVGLPLKTPGEQMMADHVVEGIYSGFSLAANPATLLYLCSLGYDCSENGPLSMYLCLFFCRDTPAACQVSVQEFYLDHYLSPNLLEDVLMLYQWMERHYGT